jgi:Tat protein secretion system quality control protein TatD with DNase activity
VVRRRADLLTTRNSVAHCFRVNCAAIEHMVRAGELYSVGVCFVKKPNEKEIATACLRGEAILGVPGVFGFTRRTRMCPGLGIE